MAATEQEVQAAIEAERIRAGQEVLGMGGLPRVAVDPSGAPVNRTALPDFVANNPAAYARIAGMQKHSPLEWAKFASEGPYSVGSSNGLILYAKPKKAQGAAAAVLADILNAQGQRRFEESIGVPENQRSSQLGQLGDIANQLLDWGIEKWQTRNQGSMSEVLPGPTERATPQEMQQAFPPPQQGGGMPTSMNDPRLYDWGGPGPGGGPVWVDNWGGTGPGGMQNTGMGSSIAPAVIGALSGIFGR